MRYLFLIILALFQVTPAAALIVDHDTIWGGEQTFRENIKVLPGVTLTIKAGAKLNFEGVSLEVAGRLVAEGAILSGENWEGLRLKGTDATTQILDCVIAGAATGIFVQGGAPVLERLTIADNKIGIELRGKAAGRVVDCRFKRNRKIGLFVKDDSVTAVTGCRFENNLRYGAYVYRSQPKMFKGNSFVDNNIGLMVAYHGTDPEVSENRFEKNEIAIQVDRAARPVISGNLLYGNQTGLYIYRRSDPLVTGNLIEKNTVGLLVAYSSYPQIEGNDFLDNSMAVKLEFQSSEWETRRGAETRAGETSARSAFAGQGMRSVTEDDLRAKRLDGVVTADHNWWGEDGTLELGTIGPDGNPSFVYDGRDQATFFDAGEEYPFDKVTYAPWSKIPVTEIER